MTLPAVPAVAAVLGVDVGTTGARSVAYTRDGVELGSHEVRYPLRHPAPHEAVQDADAVVAATLETMRLAGAAVRARDARLVGVGLGTALHTLVGVDARQRPLTPLLTWADNRAAPQAARLRAADPGLYARTGTPVHAMAPVAKVRWFREEQPAVFARVARWVSIKEHLLAHLSDEHVVDHGVASATGLLDIHSLRWDPGALAQAGIPPARLSPVVPAAHVVRLTTSAAAHLGFDVPIVVGSGDGQLANLGAGATRPGVAACTVGTSGALRVVLPQRRLDPRARLFCYALDADNWVVGGPINSGGAVLRWVRDALFPDARDAAAAAGEEPYEWLTRTAAAVPAGAEGVIVLPHLHGERAPQWDAQLRAVVWGLGPGHDRGHVIRAFYEAIAYQLRAVAELIGDVDVAWGRGERTLRVTGGFTRAALFRQILADVLRAEVASLERAQASAFGAALLAFVALGHLDSFDAAAALAVPAHVHTPEAGAAETYDERFGRFTALSDLLAATFHVGDV